MAKSVNLLKEAIDTEESSIKKYEKALAVMAHDDSKRIVGEIIKSKKEHIDSVLKIIEQSSKCPAIINEQSGGK